MAKYNGATGAEAMKVMAARIKMSETGMTGINISSGQEDATTGAGGMGTGGMRTGGGWEREEWEREEWEREEWERAE